MTPRPDPSEYTPRRSLVSRDRFVYLLLFAVSVLVRIPFLRAFDLVAYDGTYYINEAKSMLGGLPTGGAYPIGYPACIALFLAIVRDGVRAAQIVSFVAGIGSVWILYALGKRMVSRTSAFLAALILAVTPVFIRLSLTTLSESVFIFWVLLGFYLFERSRNTSFGLSMGMAAITRPEGLSTFAALFLLRRTPRRRIVLALGGFLAVYAVNVVVLSAALHRPIFVPKIESFGTTTTQWQAREAWVDFAGRDSLQSEFEVEGGANLFIDAVKRFPRELMLLGLHAMPVAALLALFGVFKRRSFLLAGFVAFLFYPFFTPRSDPRHILAYLPFVFLYAAVGLDQIRRDRLRLLAGVLLVVSSVLGLVVNRDQLLEPISDGFEWAKKAGLAWRERVHPGDKVADRKPYFAFYAAATYVKFPIGPYDETVQHLLDDDVRFFMLHRNTIEQLRPALAPLLYDEALVRGELRYRRVEIAPGLYVLYEKTGVADPLRRRRITAPVEGLLVAPSWSPDGKMIAYRWVPPRGPGGIFIVPAEGGEPQRVVREPGTNDPLAWGPDSKRICFASARGDHMNIDVFDIMTGELEHITTGPAVDRSPSWSRDGREIVFWSSRSGEAEIWVRNLETKGLTQLTTDGGNTLPAVSPNGERVAWKREGVGLVILDRSTGQRRVATVPKKVTSAPAWSPDGRFIAVTAGDRAGGADVYLLTSDGSEALVLTKSMAGNGMPSWSPDGRRMVVVTNEAGDFGLWVLSGLEPYMERLLSPLTTDGRIIVETPGSE